MGPKLSPPGAYSFNREDTQVNRQLNQGATSWNPRSSMDGALGVPKKATSNYVFNFEKRKSCGNQDAGISGEPESVEAKDVRRLEIRKGLEGHAKKLTFNAEEIGKPVKC